MKEKETLEKHINYAMNLQHFLKNSRCTRAYMRTHTVSQKSQSTEYLYVCFLWFLQDKLLLLKLMSRRW